MAANPGIGRQCEWIKPSLRRFEKGSHVVFFREVPDGILIARILHQRMLPASRFFDVAV